MAHPLIPKDYEWNYTITSDNQSYRIEITREEDVRNPVDALVAFIAERLLKKLSCFVTVQVASDSGNCILLSNLGGPLKKGLVKALAESILESIKAKQYSDCLIEAIGGEDNGFFRPAAMR